ncbi:MAG: transglutaminase-like domain-containing protein [Bacteroides sp.]|nr:transglutaminase-like domain-containing protein [Bacteroides sp.]MCM1388857.1 transglutaminase-like domain-containing protein [Bacteroides sp.]
MKPSITITLLLAILFSSCNSNDRMLELSLEMAGDNRNELEAVIKHYADEPLKREAAEWLIANMPGHSSVYGKGVSEFADSVTSRILSGSEGDKLWDSIRNLNGAGEKIQDVKAVNSQFLIENVDMAFSAWEKCGWHYDVDFDLFKKYILPYRSADEMLRYGWRDSLFNEYFHLVAGINDPIKAYEIIRKTVHSKPRTDRFSFPYTLDPVSLGNHFSGGCIDRCVYLASVCRAVGLPVAIDNCGRWANYSDNNHTWVALVLKDGTYTIIDDDSIARKDNIIDASTFKQELPMPAYYPYTGEFKKRLVKVWRTQFDSHPVEKIPEFTRGGTYRFHSPWLLDVSSEYGLSEMIEIKVDRNIEGVWLCTHTLGNGWMPQVYSKAKNGEVQFEHLADSVMLLPVATDGVKIYPLGLPFFMSNGIKHESIPDINSLTEVTLTRKYPIVAKWLNRFAQIPGTRMEFSHNPEVCTKDSIFTISEVPLFFNSKLFDNSPKGRYLRIVPSTPEVSLIRKVNVYDTSDSLIKSAEWVEIMPTIDLGKINSIGKIEYFPWNDGNFVVPGHEYRLDFWNGAEWQPIQSQISNGYELTFSGIPTGALLLLNDLTEGKEERPFTLNDGKQVWW